jgi:hypothetical protein
VLHRPEEAAILDEWIHALERRRSSHAELPWEGQVTASAPDAGNDDQVNVHVCLGVPVGCNMSHILEPGEVCNGVYGPAVVGVSGGEREPGCLFHCS